MKTLTVILTLCIATVYGPRVWADEEIVPCRQTGDIVEEVEVGINITDVMALLNWLYLGGVEPEPVFCEQSGIIYPISGPYGYRPIFEETGHPGRAQDTNGDGQVDVTDAIFLLNWLFLGGPDLPQMTCVPTGEA